MKTFFLLLLMLPVFGESRAQSDALQSFRLTSRFLPAEDTVVYFLPENSTGEEKLPLVFMLHGWSGNHLQWNEITDLQQLADDFQFILVCPNGFYDGWYLESTKKPKMKYRSYFEQDLLPEILRRLPADSAVVFVTGLSMGGHGALALFCDRPELFRAAASTSGVVDLAKALRPVFGLQKYLDIKKPEEIAAFSVMEKVKNLAGKNKPFWFDCGTEDFFYRSNRALRKRCDSLKISAVFVARPGGHHKSYWKRMIKYHFAFFREILGDSAKK